MPTINFKGKNSVTNYHLTTAYHRLLPDKKKSVLPAGQEPNINGNMIIHGDNLLALKALMPTHGGRINCIYIDPPYNTGNEEWCYNDHVNNAMMREWLGKAVDRDDLTRHDKWCCMMYPRLSLLQELLAEDGMIFISIDDNEQHRLRLLMDEIFGEDNFLANIIWQHRYGRSNNAKLFSNQREHILCYRKSDQITHIRVTRAAKLNQTYSNPDNDPRGDWISSSYVNPATKDQRPNLTYPITNPHNKKIVNHPTHAWKYAKKTHAEHVKDNRLWWGMNGKMTYPRLKNFLSESEDKGIVPIDLMLAESGGTTDIGTQQLREIFQSTVHEFNNPKPTRLIKNLISIAEGASKKDNFLILDSFAGSGTTAQATLELNQEDGGNRQFILVECEDYANKITAERVRRVIKNIKNTGDKTDKNKPGETFSYWQLDDKAMELQSILEGGALPAYDELAAYLFYTATGENWNPRNARKRDNFIGSAAQYEVYLYYKPDIEYLKNTSLTLAMVEKLPRKSARQRLIFAPTRYIGLDELQARNIKFCQLPYEIYRTAEKKA